MVGSWPPIAFSRRKLNNLVRPTSRTQSKYTRVYYLFTVRTQPSHLAHVPGNPSWPGANFPQGLGRIYTPPPGFFFSQGSVWSPEGRLGPSELEVSGYGCEDHFLEVGVLGPPRVGYLVNRSTLSVARSVCRSDGTVSQAR